MKQSNRWIANYIGTILLLGIFAVGALFLINVGVRVYNNVVTTNNNNFTLRTSLNYVATKIRSCDTTGSISTGKISGEDALILSETIDGDVYNTYIYYYNGAINELVQKSGYDISLDYGFEIVEAESFKVSSVDEGMLKLSTVNKAGESEEMLISLRSEVGSLE